MFYDLHIHTNHSDGTDNPAEIAAIAAARGLDVIAVCDHNVTTAYDEAADACDRLGIRQIRGVEIDAFYEGGNQHILAYDFDPQNSLLYEIMQENLYLLEDLSVQLIEGIARRDNSVSIEDYNNFKRNPRMGGWKGINYLAHKGYGGEYPQCMSLYNEYNCSLKRPYPHVREVCAAIKQAGGYAILAHPASRLPRENREKHLEKLVEYGLEGIECHYTNHTCEETDFFLNFCRTRRLFSTAGSDHHGNFARDIDGKIYEIGVIKTEDVNLWL